MEQPPGRCRMHCFCDFVQEMLGTFVNDGVNGIQTKPVEVVLAYPVDSIVDDQTANSITVHSIVVDGRAPRGLMPVSKYWAVKREIISVWSKVVVDNVEQYGDAALMGSINQ